MFKVSLATGAVLDWMVAKCEGHMPLYKNAPHANLRNKLGNIWHLDELNYSTDWSQGGPIIEREGITLRNFIQGARWDAEIDDLALESGPTPLIAAMRCYVASKLGDTVEVPKEIIHG